MLYQVATAALNPSDIASPIRSVLRRQKNTEVLLAEASEVDVHQRKVRFTDGGLPRLRLPDRGHRSPSLLLRPRRVGAAGARGSRAWRTRWRSGGGSCWPSSWRSASPTPCAATPISPSSWWAAVPPASRRRARSPRSGATRCGATSATSTLGEATVMLLEGGPRLLPSYPPGAERQGEARPPPPRRRGAHRDAGDRHPARLGSRRRVDHPLADGHLGRRQHGEPAAQVARRAARPDGTRHRGARLHHPGPPRGVRPRRRRRLRRTGWRHAAGDLPGRHPDGAVHRPHHRRRSSPAGRAARSATGTRDSSPSSAGAARWRTSGSSTSAASSRG